MTPKGPAVCLLLAVLVATFPSKADAAPSDERSTPPASRPTLAVRTADEESWPEAVASIAFELEQAGYIIDDSSSTTIMVRRGPREWGVVLVVPQRGVVVEAQGQVGQSAAIVGLHAVELVHASLLDVARRTSTLHEPAPPAPTPESPSTEEPHRRWSFEVGLTGSTLGLVGPRLGASRSWTRAQLSLAIEAGFDQNRTRTHVDGDERWTHAVRPRATARAVVGAAFVSRPGHRIRPLIGGTSEFIAPIVSSEYWNDATPMHLETIEFGMLFAPGLQLGVLWELAPKVTLSTSARGGPLFEILPIDLAGGGTFDLRPWFVSGNVSLLFGRT